MTDITRLLIAGANGIIGQALPFGIKCTHQELDVTDPNSIAAACDKHKPSAILALSSIDLRSSEKDPILAYKVNVWGVHNLACEAAKRNIPLIIISSGAIFEGPIGSQFKEDYLPSPLNVYGETKYLAELVVKSVAPKHIIIRTGWIYGDMPKKGGFANFVESAARAAKKGDLIKASGNQYGSPTLIDDLVFHIKNLIAENARGTFHISNKGGASASDIAHEIVHYFRSPSHVEQISGTNDSSSPRRSQSEVLDSSKIPMRDWKLALHDYLKKFN